MPNEQLFSQKVATQLPELNEKYENIHQARTAQKVFTPTQKTLRTTLEVSLWNDQ